MDKVFKAYSEFTENYVSYDYQYLAFLGLVTLSSFFHCYTLTAILSVVNFMLVVFIYIWDSLDYPKKPKESEDE